MQRLSPLLVLLLNLIGYSLLGQTYIYPVKIDHKWAYINARGKVIVLPKYELIGDKDIPWHKPYNTADESSLRLVERNKKLGLINQNKEEVLSPSYLEIRPLSSKFFMVKLDSSYTLVDHQENILLEERFDDIHIIGYSQQTDQTFFAAKRNGLKAVFDNTGKEILPLLFDEVWFIDAGRGYFKVKEKENKFWSLIDSNRKIILPSNYLNINAYHDNFVATFNKNGKWEAWDSLGQQILKPEWVSFNKLNQHFMLIAKNTKRQQLYSFIKKDTIPYNLSYQNIKALGDQYLLFKKNGLTGILDSLGNEILEATYYIIRSSSDKYLRVRSGNAWGLHEIGNGLVLPCEYLDIQPFRQGYAVAYKTEGATLINEEMRELLPPIYDSIRQEGKIFKGFQSNNISLIELDEKGNVIRLDDYNNVRTITIGSANQRALVEARPIKRRKQGKSPTFYIDTYTSPLQIVGSRWQWYQDKEHKRWGLRTGDKEKDIPPIFRSVKHIANGNLSLIYTYKEPVSNIFSEWAADPLDTLCRMSIFSHGESKFVSPNDFLGLRRHDFERGLPYASVIDTAGNFSLVNRNGELAKNAKGETLKFSFIGEFIDGIAKVCIGGQLTNMEDPSKLKYTLDEREVFLFAYSLIPSFPVENRYKAGRILIEPKKGQSVKWGYIDSTGNYVIEPQYEFALDFTSNQAVVVKDKNWGVVDANNETIIDFEYGSISDFYGKWRINKRVKGAIFFDKKGQQLSDGDYQRRGQFQNGFCQVMNDNLWGFINEKGKEIISCQYKYTHNFSEGLAAAYKNGYWSFLDTTGAVVINLAAQNIKVDTISDFHDGLCWFKQNGKYGFLNKEGNIQIPATYIKAFNFKHGVARIVENRKTGLIDSNGEYVLVPKRFERIDSFNQWAVAVVMETFKSRKKGLINAQGEILTDIKYKVIDDFKNGLGIASTDGKKYTLINSKGKEIIPQDYEVIGEASGGLVPVKKLKWHSWHYLDTLGNIAFEGEFEVVSPFKGDFAEVQVKRFDPETRKFIDKQGKTFSLFNSQVEFFEGGIAGVFLDNPPERRLNYCYTDTKGNHLFNKYFQEIEPFHGDNALIKRNWRNGFINKRGFMIIKPKYIALQRLEEGMILARPPAFGISNRDGDIIIPAKYDNIELMTGKIYRVEQGEKIGYLKENGKWIWDLQN